MTLDGLLSRILNMHKNVYRLFDHVDYVGTKYEDIAQTSKWKKVRVTLEKIKGLLEALGNYELIVASNVWKERKETFF